MGALVWIRVGDTERHFQVFGGSGQFAPHGPRTIHIGLGAAKGIDGGRIRWPNRAWDEQRIPPLEGGTTYRIRQGRAPVRSPR